MKTSLLFILSLLFVVLASAQQKVVQLYDKPIQGSESWNWTEAESDNNEWHLHVVYNVANQR